MSKIGVSAAIIRWNPGFDRARFAVAKGQGLIQSTFDTVRKSRDGNKAFVSWRGTRPSELNAGIILMQGTYAEVVAHMNGNRAEWGSRLNDLDHPAPVMRMAYTMDSNTRPEVEAVPPKERQAWKWAAAVAAVGAAAAAYYYFVS